MTEHAGRDHRQKWASGAPSSEGRPERRRRPGHLQGIAAIAKDDVYTRVGDASSSST